MILFIFIFGTTTLLAAIDLCYYLFYKEGFLSSTSLKWVEITSIIIAPLLFLSEFDFHEINDCCSDSAVFSPSHRLSIYSLILLSVAAYFYSSWRQNLAAPLFELIINCFLITGLILNIIISIHLKDVFFWLLGNVSIICLFLTSIIKNHLLLFNETSKIENNKASFINKIGFTILRATVFLKFPLLLLLCLPLLLLLAALLFVFGQQPDSAIKAFTDTYKHGFSQLDYMCDNVQCGGHYLCSVAANGHRNIVKPKRFGTRNGGRIICNRQLLISNAFEELVEQRIPTFHKMIRKKYDRVGDFVHRYYSVFSNKFFSDTIYILMKPMEWMFLITLYLFDRKPENRIAQQYLDQPHRDSIRRINY